MKYALLILLYLPVSAIAERPINELPMYGGQHEPTIEESKELSLDAARRGWKAYYQGDPDQAMRRFNQAWMFDRDNPEVFWGFGLVMQRRAETENPKENLREAIQYLGIAHEKAPRDGRILGDLAFAHAILGNHVFRETSKDNAHRTLASEYFEKAYRLTPDYPPIVAHWAMHLFWLGDLRHAEAKVSQAQAAGYPFDPRFLEDLEAYAKGNRSKDGNSE